MLINASSGMNLANGVRLPSSSRIAPPNGVRVTSSSRMNLSNGVRLRSSSSIHDVGVFHRTLDYGLSRVIEGGVGHGVMLNYRVLPIRCLGETSLSPTGYYETIPNSSDVKETTNGVSDADFYEHFEAWCKKYGKTYSSEEHKRYRFKLFKDNYPIKPPHKNYLSLKFLNENAADDHPNGTSLPLDIKDAIHKYGFGLSKYMCDIPAQPGTIYLHNNGNPLTVPLDSNTSNAAFLKRFDMDGDQLNSWRIKVTESMIKGDCVLNFPRRISKRFLIHNSSYIKVIDQEFGAHFQCNLKSSSRDFHEKFLTEGWNDFVRAKKVKEGDILRFTMSNNGGMMLAQKEALKD